MGEDRAGDHKAIPERAVGPSDDRQDPATADLFGETTGPSRRGGPDAAGPRRAALEARWLDLTRRVLPEAAGPGWPVRLDHCFQRILLDNAVGGVWYGAIPGRPAYRHAPEAVLREAVQLGEDVLAGRADLAALNRVSLAWRGKEAVTPGRAASPSRRRTSPG